MEVCPNADLIVRVDSDEAWEASALQSCVEQALKSPARNFLIKGFDHFWRSFDWVCRDPWAPVRLIRPKGHGDQILEGKIFHCGYCQSEKIVKFKLGCHGHKSELRPGWFEEIFLAFPERLTDLHPVVFNWWNAERFDKTSLPDTLKTHVNYSKEVVK